MKKIVLITGASSGMGKVTAQLLEQDGYTVYGAARRTERMKDLENKGIHTIEMDITSEESMVSAVEHIIAKEGRIDILINNAGYGDYGAIEDVSIDKAKNQMQVNVFGAARLIQLVLPKMRQNNWGKIVNISSVGGKLAQPYGGWYHASKFAIEGLSDSLRNEVKQFGIDVILVQPGAVKSEWAEIAIENLQENSKESAYKQSIDKMSESLKGTLQYRSEPNVIANIIKEAIEAEQPEARYFGGFMAVEILTARKNMSDKEFDEMLMSQMK